MAGFFVQQFVIKVKENRADRKHEIEHKLDIVRRLGGEVSEVNLKAGYGKEDEAFINSILSQEGIGENYILVGINCSTFRPSRNWSINNYAKLADEIMGKLKIKTVLLGAAKEKGLSREIEKHMRNKPLNLVGKLNLRQLAAFLKKCTLLISPDSGPVHIAAALKTPLIVLFGPGEYERYRPWDNEEQTIVIRKEVECAPCFKRNCRNNQCMKLITSQEVFEAVKQLLNRYNV